MLNPDGSVARTAAQPFGPGGGTRAAAGDGVAGLMIGTNPGAPSRVVVLAGASVFRGLFPVRWRTGKRRGQNEYGKHGRISR